MAHKILEATGEEHKRLKVSGNVLFKLGGSYTDATITTF